MKVSVLLLKIWDDGRTQKEIAGLCGFPSTRISEYVHGKKVIPLHHLDTLARVLGCEPEELLGESDLHEVS